ncbi:MAG: hypothetical protein QXK86_08245 [Candidatus Bathyarchaeia archaeon]
MVRRVIIKAILVPESSSIHPKEIEREILREIRTGCLIIPWCDYVERVVVIKNK